MQIIGSRPESTFRVPSDYFEEKTAFMPGVDPTTGGPCTVVDDYSDTPAKSAAGMKWVVDIDPDSRTFRKVVQVKDPDYVPAKRRTKKLTSLPKRQPRVVEEEDDE